MIRYATDETYKELVSEGAVLVDFFGKTCIPCKMTAAVLEDLDDEFPFLNIVKVDVDDCPDTADEFDIEGIPDLYFYKDGEIVAREIGAVDESVLREHLSKVLYEGSKI